MIHFSRVFGFVVLVLLLSSLISQQNGFAAADGNQCKKNDACKAICAGISDQCHRGEEEVYDNCLNQCNEYQNGAPYMHSVRCEEKCLDAFNLANAWCDLNYCACRKDCNDMFQCIRPEKEAPRDMEDQDFEWPLGKRDHRNPQLIA